LPIKQVHVALKKNERKEKVPNPSQKIQEHINVNSSSTNEESSDETNSLIIPFEGALREKGEKRAMECKQNLGGTKGRGELECSNKCA
jgi:hypothetical protein